MTNSDKLREQLASEENDLKALGIGKKLIREERSEKFEETWLPKLRAKCNVIYDAQTGRYTFELNGYGVMDFYPKANKVLIRKLNKWKQPGLKWIITEFHLDADIRPFSEKEVKALTNKSQYQNENDENLWK